MRKKDVKKNWSQWSQGMFCDHYFGVFSDDFRIITRKSLLGAGFMDFVVRFSEAELFLTFSICDHLWSQGILHQLWI